MSTNTVVASQGGSDEHHDEGPQQGLNVAMGLQNGPDEGFAPEVGPLLEALVQVVVKPGTGGACFAILVHPLILIWHAMYVCRRGRRPTPRALGRPW